MTPMTPMTRMTRIDKEKTRPLNNRGALGKEALGRVTA